MAVGVHIPLRFLRAAIKKGISVLKERIPTAQTQQTTRVLEPVYNRLPLQSSRPQYAQRIKVSQCWYTTALHNALRDAGLKDAVPRATKAPHIRAAVGRLTVTTPFASTLRPKLVGGAMPRSAGGYSIGGSARFFSHTPAAPAQVISQVAAAMRVLATKGKMEGLHYRTDGRTASRVQRAAALVGENAPGAYIDFFISPTLTCLPPFNTQSSSNTLGDEGFMEGLATDFRSMRRALDAVEFDLEKLGQWGDLPITRVGPAGDVLRVHFRGHSGKQVESICNELGITTGVVHEDDLFAFNLLALDPRLWGDFLDDSPPASSIHPEGDLGDHPSGSESYAASDYFDLDQDFSFGTPSPGRSVAGDHDPFRSIHEFLENCFEYPSGLRPRP